MVKEGFAWVIKDEGEVKGLVVEERWLFFDPFVEITEGSRLLYLEVRLNGLLLCSIKRDTPCFQILESVCCPKTNEIMV